MSVKFAAICIHSLGRLLLKGAFAIYAGERSTWTASRETFSSADHGHPKNDSRSTVYGAPFSVRQICRR